MVLGTQVKRARREWPSEGKNGRGSKAVTEKIWTKTNASKTANLLLKMTAKLSLKTLLALQKSDCPKTILFLET